MFPLLLSPACGSGYCSAQSYLCVSPFLRGMALGTPEAGVSLTAMDLHPSTQIEIHRTKQRGELQTEGGEADGF